MAATRRTRHNTRAGVAAALIALAVAGCVDPAEKPQPPDDVITYRGEAIRLTKPYADYEDYQDDPDNIHPSEFPRIERLVCDAKVAPSLAD